MAESNIEIKQYRRNTAYSWALFRNGFRIITGLTLEQAIKEKEKKDAEAKNSERDFGTGICGGGPG